MPVRFIALLGVIGGECSTSPESLDFEWPLGRIGTNDLINESNKFRIEGISKNWVAD